MFGPVRALIVLAVALSSAAVCAESTVVEGLARQASLGFRTEPEGAGLAVRSLDVTSAAALAKLADGDVITAINGKTFAKPYVGQEMLGALRGGVPVELAVTRAGARSSLRFTPSPRPLEQISGVETQYGSLKVRDGARLRTLVARRSGLKGSLPPLLFTQWVSCGTLEYRRGSNSGELLARFARDSGMALVRVDRAGAGDSEGPPCHQLDYDTEVAHYIDAFDQILRTNASFDREHIVVMGSSLGSTTAPLVARGLEQRGHRIAGVTINGGGAVTYFERMLNFDRFHLERRPEAVQPAEINPKLEQHVLFEVEYLLKGRSPDDIARDSPAMAAVRADTFGLGDGEHYGRPYAYHQQAARKNFLEAWTSLERARVLVLYGEYDQFEARHGHEIIAAMVNRVRPGSAEYVEMPRVDHESDLHPTIESAYAFSDRGVPAIEVHLEIVMRWLWASVGVKPPA
jgi:hypothetical protein